MNSIYYHQYNFSQKNSLNSYILSRIFLQIRRDGKHSLTLLIFWVYGLGFRLIFPFSISVLSPIEQISISIRESFSMMRCFLSILCFPYFALQKNGFTGLTYEYCGQQSLLMDQFNEVQYAGAFSMCSLLCDLPISFPSLHLALFIRLTLINNECNGFISFSFTQSRISFDVNYVNCRHFSPNFALSLFRSELMPVSFIY